MPNRTIVLATLSLAVAAVAHAELKEPENAERIELPDVLPRLATLGGKVIHVPGSLDTKPSTFYGCGFDKAKYIAVELVDRKSHFIAYCPRANKDLRCGDLGKEPSKIMVAYVKLPAKPGACKEPVGELLYY